MTGRKDAKRVGKMLFMVSFVRLFAEGLVWGFVGKDFMGKIQYIEYVSQTSSESLFDLKHPPSLALCVLFLVLRFSGAA